MEKIEACLITPNVEKIQKRMLVVVAEVFGHLLFTTYESFKYRCTREEIVKLFSKENILKIVGPALDQIYIELTNHLIEESFISEERDDQLITLIDNVIKKMIVFPKDITRIYIFNICMRSGISALSTDRCFLPFINDNVSLETIQESIVWSCYDDYRFIMNYYPQCEKPVLTSEMYKNFIK